VKKENRPKFFSWKGKGNSNRETTIQKKKGMLTQKGGAGYLPEKRPRKPWGRGRPPGEKNGNDKRKGGQLRAKKKSEPPPKTIYWSCQRRENGKWTNVRGKH